MQNPCLMVVDLGNDTCWSMSISVDLSRPNSSAETCLEDRCPPTVSHGSLAILIMATIIGEYVL